MVSGSTKHWVRYFYYSTYAVCTPVNVSLRCTHKSHTLLCKQNQRCTDLYILNGVFTEMTCCDSEEDRLLISMTQNSTKIIPKLLVLCNYKTLRRTLKKKFRTHVIKLDIAPMSFPPGKYLLASASNNMLYYLSQWDKIRTTCVANLMSQDTKFWLFKINCARIWTHNLQDNTLIL